MAGVGMEWGGDWYWGLGWGCGWCWGLGWGGVTGVGCLECVGVGWAVELRVSFFFLNSIGIGIIK